MVPYFWYWFGTVLDRTKKKKKTSLGCYAGQLQASDYFGLQQKHWRFTVVFSNAILLVLLFKEVIL